MSSYINNVRVSFRVSHTVQNALMGACEDIALSFGADFDSRVSTILDPFSEPSCTVTQIRTLLKKHGLSTVMSLVHRTDLGAEGFLAI